MKNIFRSIKGVISYENYFKGHTVLVALATLLILSACATETHQVVETQSVATNNTSYGGPKHPLVVGKFANRSTYMNGIFSDGTDRLGSQAKTILKTHLAQTHRFTLMDRENMDEIAQEAKISGKGQSLTGAVLVVTGEVTEFGRKVTGDKAFFGIFGQGKTQVAYAKVSLNIVDVRTSQIIYAVQGAGEYSLSNREVLGTGGAAGYDATLNDKVLNFAIIDVVNKLVNGLEKKEWSLGN
jgi:curli biogenesis system outer membrane secretion channel CsgG